MGAPRAIRSWTSARGRTASHLLVLVAGVLALPSAASAETWRGLVVAPEQRCSPYDRKRDYPYPQSVERAIIRSLGGIYGPYTGTCFSSARDTDIEHIVAVSEAHDSGLRARPPELDPGEPVNGDVEPRIFGERDLVGMGGLVRALAVGTEKILLKTGVGGLSRG